jgi:hypothetical protein
LATLSLVFPSLFPIPLLPLPSPPFLSLLLSLAIGGALCRFTQDKVKVDAQIPITIDGRETILYVHFPFSPSLLHISLLSTLYLHPSLLFHFSFSFSKSDPIDTVVEYPVMEIISWHVPTFTMMWSSTYVYGLQAVSLQGLFPGVELPAEYLFSLTPLLVSPSLALSYTLIFENQK